MTNWKRNSKRSKTWWKDKRKNLINNLRSIREAAKTGNPSSPPKPIESSGSIRLKSKLSEAELKCLAKDLKLLQASWKAKGKIMKRL